jgi:hypothetical protein
VTLQIKIAQFAEAEEAQQSIKLAVDWLDSLIGPGGFAISSSLPPICSTSFSFIGGVGKK